MPFWNPPNSTDSTMSSTTSSTIHSRQPAAPQLRNPFAETTTVRSEPVILKSITELSRYEAASGSFEVVVDLTQRTSLLPSFLAGSETLFIGQGTDIAFVDFSGLKSQAIKVNAARTAVTVSLPKVTVTFGGIQPR